MPKTWELEQRVGRLENQLQELYSIIDLQVKRTLALQAQLDHLIARLRS
jgi:uncharacterized coiled-coil protein SlyX